VEELGQRIFEQDAIERAKEWLAGQLDLLIYLLAALAENDNRMPVEENTPPDAV